MDAINQGKEVWKLLSYFKSGDSSVSGHLFVIVNGKIVESIVEHLSGRMSWNYYRVGETVSFAKTQMVKWTGEKSTTGLKICLDVHATSDISGIKKSVHYRRELAIDQTRWSERIRNYTVTRGSVSDLDDREYEALLSDRETRISDDGKTWVSETRSDGETDRGITRKL